MRLDGAGTACSSFLNIADIITDLENEGYSSFFLMGTSKVCQYLRLESRATGEFLKKFQAV